LQLKSGENVQLRKQLGLEGPMNNAISDRHVYVYGTADAPNEEELIRRRLQAEAAANWSAYRGEFLGRINVFPRVLKDSEVRGSDLESSNLVLFGTKNSNSMIDQFSEQLPIELSTSADYGLAYIFPNPNGKYVLINSGLSILDAPDSDKELDWSSRYASIDFITAVRKFDDFVVFKKDELIINGTFDNQWKLKSEDKSILSQLDVIILK